MKILHIIDSFGLGGAQTVVKGIFESQKSNKNIFLFALRKKEISTKINHKNTIIHKSNKKYSFSPLKQLKYIIEKEKIEVLHCHLFKSQFFGWILKKYYFPNIKLIIHEHGKIFKNYFYYNKFMNIAQKQTNLFLAVSRATKQKLIEKATINSKKIKVLYNFVDLGRFNRKNIKVDIQKEREKLWIKKDEFVVGFAGRLSKVKGCGYLIGALPYLNFDYKVLITGEGPEKRKLEKLAKRLKVQDKIIFLGYIEKIEKIYPLFDVLVMPSLSEASPMAFYEAQAYGIPVIGSNISAINEFIIPNKNGNLFKVKNRKDLAKEMNKIFEDKKNLKQMRKYSIENIKNYSLREYVINLNKLYSGILNGKK